MSPKWVKYCWFLLLPLLFVAVPSSASAEAVNVTVNMARILRINSPAATVIVGNPGVADVTIQDPETLILTGRSFGTTNLVVLDSQGNPIIDTPIQVVQGNTGLVTVYQGAARTSLSCEPVCQPVIMLGDDNTFTSTNVSSQGLIIGAAGN